MRCASDDGGKLRETREEMVEAWAAKEPLRAEFIAAQRTEVELQDKQQDLSTFIDTVPDRLRVRNERFSDELNKLVSTYGNDGPTTTDIRRKFAQVRQQKQTPPPPPLPSHPPEDIRHTPQPPLPPS